MSVDQLDDIKDGVGLAVIAGIIGLAMFGLVVWLVARSV